MRCEVYHWNFKIQKWLLKPGLERRVRVHPGRNRTLEQLLHRQIWKLVGVKSLCLLQEGTLQKPRRPHSPWQSWHRRRILNAPWSAFAWTPDEEQGGITIVRKHQIWEDVFLRRQWRSWHLSSFHEWFNPLWTLLFKSWLHPWTRMMRILVLYFHQFIIILTNTKIINKRIFW